MNKLRDAIPAVYEMLAWMEANPDIVAPNSIDMTFCQFNKVEAAEVVRAFGKGKKRHVDSYIAVTKTFAGESDAFAKLIVPREVVCKRKVVGTRVVPAVNTPERVEEIAEWQCGSILKLEEPVKELPAPVEHGADRGGT